MIRANECCSARLVSYPDGQRIEVPHICIQRLRPGDTQHDVAELLPVQDLTETGRETTSEELAAELSCNARNHQPALGPGGHSPGLAVTHQAM